MPRDKGLGECKVLEYVNDGGRGGVVAAYTGSSHILMPCLMVSSSSNMMNSLVQKHQVVCYRRM